jgi:spore germination protein GerM
MMMKRLTALALLLVLAGCGAQGVDDRGTVAPSPTTATVPAGDTTVPAADTTVPAADTTVPAADTTAPAADTTVHDTTVPTTEPTEPMVVYFMMDQPTSTIPGPFLVPVYREGEASPDVLRGALELLLAGPTEEESAYGPPITSAVPGETILLGVSVGDGLATIDLSREFESGGGSFSMFARLAQLVYTATQFDTVDRVELRLDGSPVTVFSSEGIGIEEPMTRDDYLDLLPLVFLDRPAWGEPIGNPVRLIGKANAFEAVFQVTIVDSDGLILYDRPAMATCGTGCWGDFDVSVEYDPIELEQRGAIILWEASARDGSQTNVREYPVRLVP